MFTIRDSANGKKIEALNSEQQVVGEAIFSLFKPSDIYERPRLSIYIDIQPKVEENTEEVKDFLFDELIKRGQLAKAKQPEIDMKIYHCCFVDQHDTIAYYTSKPGFVKDDGMYIIEKVIGDEKLELPEFEEVTFTEIIFKESDVTKELIRKQNDVFGSGYTLEDLLQMHETERYVSIAAYCQGELAGNVIVLVKQDELGESFGWIEDLFISKPYRKMGISKALMHNALNWLQTNDIQRSRLEVWSENERALKLYYGLGYHFIEETETAIGMFL